MENCEVKNKQSCLIPLIANMVFKQLLHCGKEAMKSESYRYKSSADVDNSDFEEFKPKCFFLYFFNNL